MNEKLGDRIGSLMKELGYTQKELATMVGVTESAMSRYLNNEREPKLEIIANLATALNTTSDFLISGEKDENSFEEIYRLVARGTSTMSTDEKFRMMKLLIENNEK